MEHVEPLKDAPVDAIRFVAKRLLQVAPNMHVDPYIEGLIKATISASIEHMFDTVEGRNMVMQKMKIHEDPADSDAVFEVFDDTGSNRTLRVAGKHVRVLSSYIVHGHHCSPVYVDQYDAKYEQCACCYTMKHCYKPVPSPTDYGRIINVCNHCLMASDIKEWHDACDSKECDICTIKKCDFHPQKIYARRNYA